jgi:transcriptional regulator with XRE-family HTH domain
MPNERLRDALFRNGLTLEKVAAAVDVDPKTVERWITKGRLPYPKHRHKIAAMARESETYLWPEAIAPERKAESAAAELVQVFPHRNAVPVELWDRLIKDATHVLRALGSSPGDSLTWRRRSPRWMSSVKDSSKHWRSPVTRATWSPHRPEDTSRALV